MERKSNSLLRTIAALMLICSSSAAFAQSSQRLTAGKSNEYGLIYNLPSTVADVYIKVELTESTPGEFHNYARRYLGVTDAITAPSRQAQVTDAVIVPRGVADRSTQWLAQFKAGSTPFMMLSPENVPLGINTERTYPVPSHQLAEPTPWSQTPLDGSIATQAITGEMARSSSTSKRAELAAQRIFELREMRSDILSGQADNMPSDGRAMQLVLDNIAGQEAALTAMFTGVTRTRTMAAKVTLVPDSIDINDRIIARVSSLDGILDADNLAGEPITADVKVIERGTLPVNDRGETKKFPNGGVAYCIPGSARVTVSFRGTELASLSLPVAQLGVVFGLNPALFTDKREPSMVVFDPTCGAVVELGPAN